jgi:hypothetical protein
MIRQPHEKTEAAIGLPFPVLFFNYSLSFTVQPEGMPLSLTSYLSTSCLWDCLYLKGMREVVCKSEVNMGGKFAGMEIFSYLCSAFENQMHRRFDGAGRKPTKTHKTYFKYYGSRKNCIGY